MVVEMRNRAVSPERFQAKDALAMRFVILLACGAMAACTTGNVSVPTQTVLYQAPAPSASSSGGGDFVSTIEGALAADGTTAATGLQTTAVAGVGPAPTPTPLDADTLNLTLYTIEQQKIDARIAQQELDAARSQLVVVQPTSVPQGVAGVNIALYANQTTNAVGERVYGRSGVGFASGCRGYRTADDAQRAFLAAGGPASDPRGLDPDGDGFACDWDPTPYRELL
jgi:hypothetical protein